MKKAWRIIVKENNEPWCYEDIIVYAETRGKARSLGLEEARYQGMVIPDVTKYYISERDVEYTDISAKRYKEMDKYLYNGKEETKQRIEQIQWVEKRDEYAKYLSENFPNKIALVWAGCYGAWWGKNRSGYSESILYSGKYTTKEAYEIVRGSDYSRQEEVKLFDEDDYNTKLNSDIQTQQLIIDKAQKEIERLNTFKS